MGLFLMPLCYLSMHPLCFLKAFLTIYNTTLFIPLVLCLMAILPGDFKLCEGRDYTHKVLHCTVNTYPLSKDSKTLLHSYVFSHIPSHNPTSNHIMSPLGNPDKSSCSSLIPSYSFCQPRMAFLKYRSICILPLVTFLYDSVLPSR